MDWIYAVSSSVLTLLALWFWKPWAGAYAAEKAKNKARKEDLDKILDEVRAVTATQEEIESKISMQLADRDRHMRSRLDVYLDAVDAISRLSSVLGSGADMVIPDREVFQSVPLEIGKLSKIQVIASDETISAVNKYMEAVSAELTAIGAERALIKLQEANGLLDPAGAALRGYALMKRATAAGFTMAELMVPALIAVRKELEIPLDVERYTRESAEMLARLRNDWTKTLRPFDAIAANIEKSPSA